MSSCERWVLQFCHSYYGPFTDCARQYAALFKDSGYRVATVYLSGEPSDEVERASASDEVVFLGYSPRDIKGLKIRAMLDLRRLVKQRDYAFCIAHRFKPIYITLMATRLPVVGIHHSAGVYSRWNRRLVVNRFRSRLLLLGVSDAICDEIRADLKDWPVHQVQRLYNRIDIPAVKDSQLGRDEARHHLGLPQDAWVIGNVGRLHPDKDQDTLIRGFALALPALPPGSLLAIMGTGRLESRLKALVTELGLDDSVVFLGQVRNGRDYFKAFDVFALTSDNEPFGMVLLEAMAAGVPLVSSDSGGAREIVSGIGRLFPLGDAQALARQLQELGAVAEGERRLMREAMEARLSARFSDDAVRPQFFDLLKRSGICQSGHPE